MNTAGKILKLMLSFALIAALSGCGAVQNTSEEESETLQVQTTFVFELENGPEVTIDIDPDSGYTMNTVSNDTEEESEDEDEDTFDFTISSEGETIYGSFKTVTTLTGVELYYYPGYEEIEIGGFEGFLVQADEDVYDLLLELDDNDTYICLTAYEADTDLTLAAQALTITVSDQQ